MVPGKFKEKIWITIFFLRTGGLFGFAFFVSGSLGDKVENTKLPELRAPPRLPIGLVISAIFAKAVLSRRKKDPWWLWKY